MCSIYYAFSFWKIGLWGTIVWQLLNRAIFVYSSKWTLLEKRCSFNRNVISTDRLFNKVAWNNIPIKSELFLWAKARSRKTFLLSHSAKYKNLIVIVELCTSLSHAMTMNNCRMFLIIAVHTKFTLIYLYYFCGITFSSFSHCIIFPWTQNTKMKQKCEPKFYLFTSVYIYICIWSHTNKVTYKRISCDSYTID